MVTSGQGQATLECDMNLQDIIMQAAGGGAVEQLAGRFGIDPNQAQSVVQALLPAIQGGFKQQAQTGGGIESILGGLVNPDVHAGYIDNAAQVAAPEATAHGNEILGQIFGSKDVSRAVAGNAAQSTGIDQALIQQMLPVITAMAAGALAKGAAGAGGAQAGGGGGLLGSVLGMVASAAGGQQAGGAQAGGVGGLAKMLDMDGDGNPLNDVMGMLGKLTQR
jgi:hypothetical protein